MSRWDRGASTIIELLAVIGMIGILTPLVIGLMTESHQRLSPGGPAGRRVLAVQSASAALEGIQADLERADRVRQWFLDDDPGRSNLMLESPGQVVVWRLEGGDLFRIRVDRRTGERSRQLRLKGVTELTFDASHPALLRISLRAGGGGPGSMVRTYSTVLERQR